MSHHWPTPSPPLPPHSQLSTATVWCSIVAWCCVSTQLLATCFCCWCCAQYNAVFAPINFSFLFFLFSSLLLLLLCAMQYSLVCWLTLRWSPCDNSMAWRATEHWDRSPWRDIVKQHLQRRTSPQSWTVWSQPSHWTHSTPRADTIHHMGFKPTTLRPALKIASRNTTEDSLLLLGR